MASLAEYFGEMITERGTVYLNDIRDSGLVPRYVMNLVIWHEARVPEDRRYTELTVNGKLTEIAIIPQISNIEYNSPEVFEDTLLKAMGYTESDLPVPVGV